MVGGQSALLHKPLQHLHDPVSLDAGPYPDGQILPGKVIHYRQEPDPAPVEELLKSMDQVSSTPAATARSIRLWHAVHQSRLGRDMVHLSQREGCPVRASNIVSATWSPRKFKVVRMVSSV